MSTDELFPVGRPAGPEDMVDREEFIDQTVTRLVDRNSVILAAPRRAGKTSVAFEILRRLREQAGAYTAEVDLSSLASVRELADKLTAACWPTHPAYGCWLRHARA